MLGRLNPLRLPGASSLVAYLQPSQGVTLFGTLDSAGTTPPAVTISNNLANCADLELDIPIGGARGTATFRWREWGGAWSAPIATAASVAGIGSRGYTLAFASGTYNTNNTYRSVVGTIKGARGVVWDGETALASVRPYIGRINGRPALLFDGVTKRMLSNVNSPAPALMSGTNTPFTLSFIAQYLGSLTPSGAAPVIALASGSAGNTAVFFFYVWTDGKWGATKRGSTGASAAIPTTVAADNNPHHFEIVQAGTTFTLRVDGTLVYNAVSQAANAVDAANPLYFYLGSSSSPGTPPADNTYGQWAIGDLVAYTGARSTAELTYVRQNMKNLWGTP